jgi:hypothetical protein
VSLGVRVVESLCYGYSNFALRISKMLRACCSVELGQINVRHNTSVLKIGI